MINKVQFTLTVSTKLFKRLVFFLTFCFVLPFFVCLCYNFTNINNNSNNSKSCGSAPEYSYKVIGWIFFALVLYQYMRHLNFPFHYFTLWTVCSCFNVTVFILQGIQSSVVLKWTQAPIQDPLQAKCLKLATIKYGTIWSKKKTTALKFWDEIKWQFFSICTWVL